MDKIYIFNNSNKADNKIIDDSFAEISKLRDIDLILVDNSSKVIDEVINASYKGHRNQVDYNEFLRYFCNMEPTLQLEATSKKLVFINQDLYSTGLNWCFGGFSRLFPGEGYIVLSTNRINDALHLADIIGHEAGHMFNAPSYDRKNTYQSLGLHCSNELCVMQQKLTVEDSIQYAYERKAKNTSMYCNECKEDIKKYNDEIF